METYKNVLPVNYDTQITQHSDLPCLYSFTQNKYEIYKKVNNNLVSEIINQSDVIIIST